MATVENVELFMNGVELFEEDGIQLRALSGFVKRLVLDFMEPNQKSKHKCNDMCKRSHGVAIGGGSNGIFLDCAPR